MKLHQLKIDFNAEQDRLLMLVSTDDGAEVRMWLTRRFVKLLWPLLVKLAEEASPRIKVQASAEARKALDGIDNNSVYYKDAQDQYEAAKRSNTEIARGAIDELVRTHKCPEAKNYVDQLAKRLGPDVVAPLRNI